VVDGREEGRIQTRQTGEGLGVDAVALARVVVDRPEFASVGDQDVVAQILEQMACPTRVSTDLHGYPAGVETGELALQGGLCGGQARFFEQFTIRVENGEVRTLVSQVQSDEKHAILIHGRFLLLHLRVR
jgi:hypothetical protein